METEGPREIRYEGIHCELTIQQFPARVIVIRVSGNDVGEFGDRPLRKLQELLVDLNVVSLFIDARDVKGVSIEVSGEWAQWLGVHKEQLRRISMLTGSRLNEVTADFVRRFAGIQDIMRIYSDPASFDKDLAASLG